MNMIRRPLRAKTWDNPRVSRASWYAVLLAAVVAAVAMLGASGVRAAPAADPAEAFVQENVEKGYGILNSTSLSDEQRRSQFRDFMLSLTDSRRIGMFTLGPYANGASKEDVESFITAFSEYAVAVYESRLSKYKGQTLKVTGSVQRAADDVVVNTDVVNPHPMRSRSRRPSACARRRTAGQS
jgi:phospholipid transport system substrate-binding protein